MFVPNKTYAVGAGVGDLEGADVVGVTDGFDVVGEIDGFDVVGDKVGDVVGLTVGPHVLEGSQRHINWCWLLATQLDEKIRSHPVEVVSQIARNVAPAVVEKYEQDNVGESSPVAVKPVQNVKSRQFNPAFDNVVNKGDDLKAVILFEILTPVRETTGRFVMSSKNVRLYPAI